VCVSNVNGVIVAEIYDCIDECVMPVIAKALIWDPLCVCVLVLVVGGGD
jgi:hypothetical protein